MEGVLTREQIEKTISNIQQNYGLVACSTIWMGIEISWERKAKKDGGYFKRKGNWGIWTYRDCVKNKELSYEEAILELLKPFNERRAEADLADIQFCIMCGDIAVGEKEQLRWGQLRYVYAIREYSLGGQYPLTHSADICGKCSQRITRGDFKVG